MPDPPSERRRKRSEGVAHAAGAKLGDAAPEGAAQIIRLVGEIYLAYGSLRSLFGTANARLNMASLEVITLGTIVEQPTPLTVAQIGRMCGYSRQAVQRAANALIAAGLARPEANPRHKRAPLLIPTQLGKETKVRSEACLKLLADDFSGALDLEQLRQLTDGLCDFRDRVEARTEALLARLSS